MAQYVLIHGSWHGGWCWTRVAQILRSHGHEVFTPTLTGSGERVHLSTPDLDLESGITDVVAVLEAEELNEVILVAHSASGPTLLGIADRVPEKIRSLVLLDATIIQNGESLRTHFTPPQEEAFQAALAAGRVPFPPPPAELFGIEDPEDVAWANRRLTPQPFSTMDSVLKLNSPPGNGLPCTYIACMAPVHPFIAESHSIAKDRADWQWQALNTGHDAMIIAPELVAKSLEAVI